MNCASFIGKTGRDIRQRKGNFGSGTNGKSSFAIIVTARAFEYTIRADTDRRQIIDHHE
jgi:hypothetical protein